MSCGWSRFYHKEWNAETAQLDRMEAFEQTEEGQVLKKSFEEYFGFSKEKGEVK